MKGRQKWGEDWHEQMRRGGNQTLSVVHACREYITVMSRPSPANATKARVTLNNHARTMIIVIFVEYLPVKCLMSFRKRVLVAIWTFDKISLSFVYFKNVEKLPKKFDDSCTRYSYNKIQLSFLWMFRSVLLRNISSREMLFYSNAYIYTGRKIWSRAVLWGNPLYGIANSTGTI